MFKLIQKSIIKHSTFYDKKYLNNNQELLWNHQISCIYFQIAVTSTRIWTSLESPDKFKNEVVPTRVIEFR